MAVCLTAAAATEGEETESYEHTTKHLSVPAATLPTRSFVTTITTTSLSHVISARTAVVTGQKEASSVTSPLAVVAAKPNAPKPNLLPKPPFPPPPHLHCHIRSNNNGNTKTAINVKQILILVLRARALMQQIVRWQ